jgi:transcriptional regulator with GAF, ATPase, and Fis domain
LGSFAYRDESALPELAPQRARPGFDVLDDVVRLPDSHGVVIVRAGDDAAAAILRHVERRGLAIGRRAVRAGDNVESAWRDVAHRLGVAVLPHEPVDAARVISRAVSRESALIAVKLGRAATWDRWVTAALAELETPALLIVLVEPDSELALSGVTEFEITSRLDAAGMVRWWEAAAGADKELSEASLSRLENWLETAADAAGPGRDLAQVPPAERELLTRLAAAGRAWPVAEISELGSLDALDALNGRALVDVRDGLVVSRSGAAPREPGDAIRVAEALTKTFTADAFAAARAAELYLESGEAARAEATMTTALALAPDSAARTELWPRWHAALDLLAPDAASGIRLRGAELALELGDVDVALDLAQRASSAEPKGRVASVLGRAALARGDLVSAAAALERARELALDDDERHAAAVQIGEVRYGNGDLDAAAAIASEVLSQGPNSQNRLTARNLLGKILLARGEWRDADAHFAADECDAICAADVTAELRARVNRAIALLSRGSSDEAASMLAQVLADAESRGEHRAVGFALSNLAVLAIERHDYARAIELLERTMLAYRRLGDRLNFARAITNLVELRLRVGLVDQAEQALRFGRQALGPGAPSSRLAELGLAAAAVHLARGRTLEAEREVRSALRAASLSTDGDKLGECHRLGARIALEDGMVARAEADVARAREIAATPFDRAEVSLIEAMIARAAGRPAGELAQGAVSAAREAGDEELAREAHVLAAEVALTQGDEESATAHACAAAALRDEVASNLPNVFAEAYLTRPALLRVARLQRLDAAQNDARSHEAPSERPAKGARSPVRYVGRHPGVRNLLDSVARVGRTDATVLVHGESGTGKELVAELLHAASARAQGPLVKVNCAALVESLLLSELFGHEKGAFTGASARRRGRFERANGGTLFLDEIGDISPRTQVALLRVLEEHTIERVGGAVPIEVDVRIVCATNRDLRSMVERGEFREDLYYRLGGIMLEVPALRDRVSDLPLLCEAILERVARERNEPAKLVSAEALELLGRHRWPGNVRELENALRAASLLSDGDVIELGDLVEHVEALGKLAAEPAASRRDGLPSMRPASLPANLCPEPADPDFTSVAYREIRGSGVSLSDLKRNIERDCIARALSESGGNITRAAALLGMKRPRLSQLVKQYGFPTNGTEDPS